MSVFSRVAPAAETTHLQSLKSALTEFALFTIAVAALCWPALVNHGPLIFPDTRSYHMNGQAAWHRVLAPFRGGTTVAGADHVDTAVSLTRTVRSVFYSLFLYVSAHTVSLWAAILVPAAILALTLRLIFNLLCPDQPRWPAALFIVLLAATTTASWTASTAMPDVFTPISVLCVITVILFWDAVRGRVRLALFAAIVCSTAMHLTTLPIVLGLLGVGSLLRIRRLLHEKARFAAIGAALVIVVGATLFVSVFGFKQWTLAPNAPPFLLARSLEDGPGRLYLQEHCPQAGLVMCNHLDKLNLSSNDFIWSDAGLYYTVSREEAAQIRSEDKRIYLRAALEHPWMQIGAIIRNSVTQASLFTLREFYIPSYVEYTDDAMMSYVRPGEPLNVGPPEAWWQMVLATPVYVVVLGGLGYALYLWKSGLTYRYKNEFLLLILAAVLMNATIVAFSEPSPRYEARIIWLVPMAALLFGYRKFVCREKATSGHHLALETASTDKIHRRAYNPPS